MTINWKRQFSVAFLYWQYTVSIILNTRMIRINFFYHYLEAWDYEDAAYIYISDVDRSFESWKIIWHDKRLYLHNYSVGIRAIINQIILLKQHPTTGWICHIFVYLFFPTEFTILFDVLDTQPERQNWLKNSGNIDKNIKSFGNYLDVKNGLIASSYQGILV